MIGRWYVAHGCEGTAAKGTGTHVDTAMMSDQVAMCLGNAATTRIGGAGHDIPMRNPARMADMVTGFLTMLD